MNWNVFFFCLVLLIITALFFALILIVADKHKNKWYDKGYDDVVNGVLNGTVNMARLSEYCVKHDACFYQLDEYSRHINEEYARGFNDGLRYLKKLYSNK